MASRNVENGIKYLFDMFNEHDADKCSAGYSEDVRFVTGRGVIEGKENVKAIFAGLFERSPEVRAEITNIIDGGNQVVYEFRLTGTGNPETDALMHCDVVTFNDAGEITAEDNYSNVVPG
jgi:predicted SnoaL-like aldol condensation-catalyzing enzyme